MRSNFASASLVKHWQNLRKNRSYRSEQKKVLIEGKKMVEEVCSHTKAISIIVTSPQLISIDLQADKIFLVSDEIIKKISSVESSEGVFAEIQMPLESTLEEKNRVLILDGINDPGNMGTLFRTAVAFGWEGIFLLPNCCDPFNDKALRAAKGSTFRIPFTSGSYADLEKIIQDNNLKVFVADLKGSSLDSISVSKKIGLVLGSESHGVSTIVKKLGESVNLPMVGQMESLNVSVAGGILMYLLRDKHI